MFDADWEEVAVGVVEDGDEEGDEEEEEEVTMVDDLVEVDLVDELVVAAVNIDLTSV